MRTILIVAVLFLVGCVTPESKFAKSTSGELKLRRQQLVEALGSSGGEFRFGNPIALAMMGNPREDRIREKEEIERELYRRWKEGDSSAKLDHFQ
jgi:hypothetical protein